MKKVILPALLAVAAISGAFGYFNQPSASEPNALTIANLDALTDIEEEVCKWERLTDDFGCLYHECTPEGNGYECVCGTIVNF